MSEIIVKKSNLKGDITLPPSKSFMHRALICAALSRSKSVISNFVICDDIKATIDCLKTLGCIIKTEDNTAYINSTNLISECEDTITLNCKESATTLRILIPVCAALGLKVKFTGENSLLTRPLKIYKEIFTEHGVNVSYDNKLPFEIISYDEEGPQTLKPGTYEVKADISSQFISGLLFAFPLLKGESKIILTSELESEGYIDLSIDVLSKYNIKINRKDNGFQVRGNQKYNSSFMHVPSDETVAAIYIAANKLGANIRMPDFENEELDNLFRHFDMDDNNNIDAKNIPDLVPVLTALASFSNCKTRIRNCKRLKYKESNRIVSSAEMAQSLGAIVDYDDNNINITGKANKEKDIINTHKDHRIIMAATIASLFTENDTVISDVEGINKSYVNFFDDIKALGGDISAKVE